MNEKEWEESWTVLQVKAEAIVDLKTLHDRELWAMRLCAEITGDVANPWWDWSEIGVFLTKTVVPENSQEVKKT